MKIGIDISQVVYTGTGVSVYIRNLVSSLLSIDRFNEYKLFGSSFRRQTELKEFINKLPQSNQSATIHHLPPRALSLIWNKLHAINIDQFIGHVDVFHTSDWTEPPSRTKKITTIHDLVIIKYPQSLPKRIISTQKQKLSWVKKESDMIITDSDSTKQDVIDYLKIPESKIVTIPLGVESIFTKRDLQEVRQVRKKYGLSGSYVLCVGTREPRKNIERTIRAFHKLRLKNTQLIIVGNYGWGRDIPPSKFVKVLGFVPRQDLPVLYSGADLFVYPSLYEGFGLPVLEAMACGCLVVTTNRSSIPEIAGKYAIMVNPESTNSIAEGIENGLSLNYQEKKLKMKLSIKQAKKFTWKDTAKKTLQLYQQLI